MKRNTNMVDKTTPAYFARQIAEGRYALLLILIFTVVNLAFLLLDTGRYFLFSASVPYYLTALGILMDVSGFGVYTTTALVISAVILVVYLLCWLLSKKRGVWLTVALVLFILDTIGLAVAAFTLLEEPASCILDLVFHILAIVALVQGVVYSGKLKRHLAAEKAAQNAGPEIQ